MYSRCMLSLLIESKVGIPAWLWVQVVTLTPGAEGRFDASKLLLTSSRVLLAGKMDRASKLQILVPVHGYELARSPANLVAWDLEEQPRPNTII